MKIANISYLDHPFLTLSLRLLLARYFGAKKFPVRATKLQWIMMTVKYIMIA